MKLTKKQTSLASRRGGGYVIEENPEPGITFLEMNSKGFYEEFAKPLFKKHNKTSLAYGSRREGIEW